MSYLQHEIALARAAADAAGQEVNHLQQQLANLTQARADAERRRDAARAQLTALQPVQTQRDQLSPQIDAFAAEEAGYASQAEQARQQGDVERARAGPLRAQLASLQTLAAQLPTLQNQVNLAQQALTAQLAAKPAPYPYSPYDARYYDWDRRRIELVNQLAVAQAALSDAQNRTAAIPTVQQAIAAADANAAHYDAQRAAALQAVDGVRTRAAPTRTRFAALEAQLAPVPALQAQEQAASNELQSLAAQLAALQPHVSAAQSRLAAARATLDALLALADAVGREPLNRAELEQVAATLAARLSEAQTALAWARTRHAAAVRRADLVTAARSRRQAVLAAAQAALNAAQATVNNRTAQLTAAQTAAANAEAARVAAKQAVDQHHRSKPRLRTGGKLNDPDYSGLLEPWLDQLAELGQQYDNAVAATLTAREQQAEAESLLQQAQTELANLTAQRNALQTEIAGLTTQLNALAGEATAAQAETPPLQARSDDYRSAREAATARLLGLCSSALPALLAPLRLETRFADGPNGPELRLRVYPDIIHVDTHEPALTAEEQQWGAQFQAQTSAPGASQELKLTAWNQLAGRFGSQRAAWIARVFDQGGPTGSRAAAWTRAPYTEILPDRWVALGYRNGRADLTVWGPLLAADPLPVGPSPDPNSDHWAAGMDWMVDFDAAVQAGMALRIPLTAEQARDGFDRVLVVGVKAFLRHKDAWAAADAAAAAARLSRLFEAHHYTRGLSFVTPETPTNNTLDRPAGYSSADPPSEQSYALERGAALIAANDGSDGALAAAALGIDSAVFAHIQNADGREQADAGAANAALWGAFESALLSRLLDAPAAPAARQHFTAWVRARGPLPALRAANQPYGLLPATSLERWRAAADDAAATLAARLQALWGSWRRFGARVPRVGRQAPLATLLRQEALACRYQWRRLSGGALGQPAPLPRAQLAAPFHARLGGLANRPLAVVQTLVAATLDLGAYRFDAWVGSLAARRLGQLRSVQNRGLHLGGYGYLEDVRPAGREASKGYLQAPSLAHAAAGAVLRSGYLAHRDSGDGAALAVDLSSERVRRARWLLDGARQGQPLGALLGYRFERALHERGLDRFIAPFRTLAVLHSEDALTAALQQAQALEAPYREAQAAAAADEAALTAANRQAQDARDQLRAASDARDRLQARRQELTDAQAAVASAQAALAAQEQALPTHRLTRPLSRLLPTTSDSSYDISLPDNDVLLPWVGRLGALLTERDAARAALAAARQRRDDLAGGPGRFDALVAALTAQIDQYERPGGLLAAAQATVTQADQQVGAVAERLRRSRQTRDSAYAAWQAAVSAVQDVLNRHWAQASESVAAHNVVDGLALARRWRVGAREQRWDGSTIPWDDPDPARAGLGLPRRNSPDYDRAQEQLQALADALDSVSDALVAESVFQLTQGNPTRSGAALDAIAAGQAAPPELDIVRTPRTGITATHRLVALFPATPPATPPWGADPLNPRANAEPALNAWTASLTPDPATVRCRVDLLAPDTDALLNRAELTLNALGLSPLDALYLAESDAVAHQSELEQRLADVRLRTRPAHAPAAARVRLDFGRDPTWPATTLSVAEWLECLRAARALATGARAVAAGDLGLPGETVTAGGDAVGQLRQRADNAKIALQQARDALAAAVAADSPGEREPARAGLRRLADFGAAGATPLPPAAGDEALLAQARSVVQEIDGRLQQLQQQESVPPPAGEAERLDFHSRRLRLIFGAEFRVLPPLAPANADALARTFAPDRNLGGDEPLAAVVWLQRVARVRDGAARLTTAFACAEALSAPARLTLRVGQLPYQQPDRWVALPPLPGQSIPGGRLSLVAQTPPDFSFTQPFTGLMLDEWVEVIPNGAEVTGVAFHYDRPDAQAPQTLLLAVAPDLRPERTPAAWDLDTLAATVGETLELARARAVAPDRLDAALWHVARDAAGCWGGFTAVEAAAGGRGPWRALACAGVGPELHLCGVAADGHLWHTIQWPDGAWQGFGDVEGPAGDRGEFREVACAGLGQTLHLCGLSSTGLWRAIRFADGSWQPFGNVEGVAGRRGEVVKIACAADSAGLHVCAVTDDGRLWHTLHRTDGAWTAFSDVKGQTGDPGFILDVACAGLSAELHVCAVATTGLWRAIRRADGSWTAFSDVEQQAGRRGHVEDLAVAGLNHEFHLRTATSEGRVWHTRWRADGGWTPFAEVDGLGAAQRLACAGVGDRLHCCDLTADALAATLTFPDAAVDLTALPS